MLTIQNNFNAQNNSVYFKSNLSLKIIRNTFFSPCEKASIDALTHDMNSADKALATKKQAYMIGIRPIKMIKNLFENISYKLH